ncbi:dUTP diphosphatase [Mycoplasmopsis sturni]|uniref:dUTP diphosphatase n=1 Tax=Mycoplasmopsis sturni TaxID=39047 RepID=UPI00055ED56C|nr:dUTP diphosphatase [Mycoplasmopsis sturni]
MNLSKIFNLQKDLDQKIYEKSIKLDKNLTQEELNRSGTIALMVEASEFANEVQSFKYWKQNKQIDRDKVLEEFADLIHFLVSFSNKHNLDPEINSKIVSDDLNIQFQALFISIGNVMKEINAQTILETFELAIGIFELLGFTYEELLQWYLIKNQKNYQRIENNY